MGKGITLAAGQTYRNLFFRTPRKLDIKVSRQSTGQLIVQGEITVQQDGGGSFEVILIRKTTSGFVLEPKNPKLQVEQRVDVTNRLTLAVIISIDERDPDFV